MDQQKIYYSARDMKQQGEARSFLSKEDGSYLMDDTCLEAVYISDCIDSGKIQTEWNSMHFNFDIEADMDVFVWIMDDEQMVKQLQGFSFEDRCYVVCHEGIQYKTSDILLYGDQNKQKGRFLFFVLNVRKVKKEAVQWLGFHVIFPAVRFSGYLPQVYQNNDELDRFLAVFQTMYLEMEREIDEFYQELHPESASAAHVDELLEWLGYVCYVKNLPMNKKRMFLSFYQKQSRYRGTKAYYENMVQFLYDCDMKLSVEGNRVIAHMDQRDENAAAFLRKELPFYMELKIKINRTADTAFADDAWLDQDSVMG